MLPEEEEDNNTNDNSNDDSDRIEIDNIDYVYKGSVTEPSSTTREGDQEEKE